MSDMFDADEFWHDERWEHGLLADMADQISRQPALTADRVAAEELGAWREEETLRRLGYCVNAGAAMDDVLWLAAEMGLLEEFKLYAGGV